MDELQAFKVKVNGKSYPVAIEQTAIQRIHATLDGRAFDAGWLSEGEFSTWKVQSGQKEVLLQVRALDTSDKFEIWVAGVPFLASVQSLGTGIHYSVVQEPGEGTHGGEIRALMPGRVTSILVKEKDHVDAGSPVLILEAMKMQNEITSPFGGHVKSIQVREGETIKKGSVLVEIA